MVPKNLRYHIEDFLMSPSIPFYGAYFPLWLVCAVVGMFGSILMRVLLIRLGIDEGIPLRVIVYVAFACLIAFTLSATVWGT
ncbi:YtcA family lipoprotein [Shewanella algae]|uniref:YtcA family lipoprotein n=1 Tax=Shewanella algae TaxID=38313 RepID=UPI003B987A63